MKCTIYFNDTGALNILQEQKYTESKSEVWSFGGNQNASGDKERKVKKAICC